ncbi:MAG: 5'-nucleotidase C-terminal domain-containing protein [Anaerolineae bacterium]|nr:5'-nucleotidase C-terminal domain-containing protein [Anaerolineae bacterium]
MQRITGLIILFCLIVPLAHTPIHAQDNGTFTLTVMHTNDAHATYDPDRTGYGGVARQATLVRQIRAESAHTLLVDSGDRFTGSMFHSFYQGQDSALVMNALGYDVMVLGSYEFTHGADVLAKFIDQLDFPAVVANVDFSGSVPLAGKVPPYVIRDFDGEQVGIIGVTQGDSRIRPIPELVFDTDYVNVIQAVADDLAGQGVTKIVLLSHLGYFADLAMAQQLTGIDVISGGDSEILLSNTDADAEGPYPAVMQSASGEPVLVVQAWSHNRVMGRLDMTFDADGVLVSWEGDALLLTEDIPQDPTLAALVEELRAPLGDFLSEKIGSTTTYLEGAEEVCRFEECNLGNLITDALRETTGAQIAVHNGGGIRASIDVGEITVGQVLDVLPFNNTFVIFELSGADIVEALENSVSRVDATEGEGRFLQVSGLRFSWDGSQPAGQRIVSVEVLNDSGTYAALDPDEIYTVAANDFLYAGGDDYAMFAENSANEYDFGRVLDEIVRDYIAANSPITMPPNEERITRVDR